MATETIERAAKSLTETLSGVRDSMSVGRVFGTAYDADGATIIPVARVMGGGGGGGGDDGGGSSDGEDRAGGDGGTSAGGFGSGFGIRAYPVGVYEVRDGHTEWKPAIDVNHVAKGGQLLAGVIAVCVTLVLLRRQR